jgi:superkiller protein 3
LITKRQYSQSTFDRILSSKSTSNIADLVQPLFALNQLHSMIPNDIMYHHLSTLFLERIDSVGLAVESLSKICNTLEADYEVTESSASLSRFALAKADLARSQLAAGLYDEAVESGETALQLSAEDAGNELSAEARQMCRLSARLTVGLAQYYNGNSTAALEYFQPALEESNGNPDAGCLLSQVLWAQRDTNSLAKARDQLFDSVEIHPDHVESVLLLGVIALMDRDTESLEAVTASLQDLRASHTLTEKEQSRVGEVLRAIAAFSEGNTEQAVRTEVLTEVFLHPDQPHGWGRLAGFDNDDYAAEMALKTAIKAVPPKGELDALDLSMAFAGTGKLGDALNAAMIAPWHKGGWEALHDVLS